MSINLELHLSKKWLKFMFAYKKSVMSEKMMETLRFVEVFTPRCIPIDLERTTRIWRDRLFYPFPLNIKSSRFQIG